MSTPEERRASRDIARHEIEHRGCNERYWYDKCGRVEAEAAVLRQAIERYLDLSSDCDYVDGEPEVCPGIEQAGGPCHWCDLRAALRGDAGKALLAELQAARAVVIVVRRGFGTAKDIEKAEAFDPVALTRAIEAYDKAIKQ